MEITDIHLKQEIMNKILHIFINYKKYREICRIYARIFAFKINVTKIL